MDKIQLCTVFSVSKNSLLRGDERSQLQIVTDSNQEECQAFSFWCRTSANLVSLFFIAGESYRNRI